MLTLREFERRVTEGAEARGNAISKINEILKFISDCEATLRSMMSDVREFEEKCKLAKVAGTTAGVTGSALTVAACVAALFTGPAAPFVLAAGTVGTAASLSGAAVNVTTSIVDAIKSKGYIERIQSTLDRVQGRAKTVEKYLVDYEKSMEFFQKHFRVDGDQAWSVVNGFWSLFDRAGQNLGRNVERVGAVGILAFGLGMLQPCSADLVALAPQVFTGLKEVYRGVAFDPSLLAKYVAQEGVKQASKTAAKEGIAAAAKNTLQVANVAEGVVQGAAKTTGKVALSSTGKVLQGVIAGVSVGFAIYDIISLVDSFKDKHPAITAIDNVLDRLRKLARQIQEQLDVLSRALANSVGTNVAHELYVEIADEAFSEVLTVVNNSAVYEALDDNIDSEDSSSSSSSEEEADRIRVYDMTPRRMRAILNGIELQSQPTNAGDPFDALERLLEEARRGSVDPGAYLDLEELLRRIVNVRGHAFVRENRVPDRITLRTSVRGDFVLDAAVRENLRSLLMPILAILRMNGNQGRSRLTRCVIYRFRCLHCPRGGGGEFNYVGQSRNFRVRYDCHNRNMNRGLWGRGVPGLDEADVPVEEKSLLYGHALLKHPEVARSRSPLSTIFEVDIVQQLNDAGDRSERASRIRRQWEVFYQWLFKALASEGGGSRQ